MLDKTSALDIVKNVYESAGKSLPQVELIRLGENAVVRDKNNSLVIRIHRSNKSKWYVQQELDITKYLVAHGFPAPQLSDEFTDQPLIEGGHCVTIWKEIKQKKGGIDYFLFGELISELHKLLRSCKINVDKWNPIQSVLQRINHLVKNDNISKEEHISLLNFIERLKNNLSKVESDGYQVIHGDCHAGNLLTGADDRLYLIDYEHSIIGPVYWDLIPTAIAFYRFNLRKKDYDRFCKGYGLDVRDIKGFLILKSLRELSMITWLMQNRRLSDRIDREVNKRLHSFLSGQEDVKWEVF